MARRGITVNVSANDLGDIAFPGFVLRTLDEYGVLPQQLELEITETALSDDIERVLESLRILSELGFRIAIDDFGTGAGRVRRMADENGFAGSAQRNARTRAHAATRALTA